MNRRLRQPGNGGDRLARSGLRMFYIPSIHFTPFPIFPPKILDARTG